MTFATLRKPIAYRSLRKPTLFRRKTEAGTAVRVYSSVIVPLDLALADYYYDLVR